MNNMDIWNALKRPPTDALKPIQAGRLKGKTDISPQWRMMALTAYFGPCGEGWTYTIDRLWTEPGAKDEVMAFAIVGLKYKLPGSDNMWSELIPGIGGSTLIANEKQGMYNSDEAFKMAVTDAIGVACKSLGVAADIYMGLFDGSKYKTVAPELIDNTKKPDQAKIDRAVADAVKLVDADGGGEGGMEASKRDSHAIVDLLSNDEKMVFQDRLKAMPAGKTTYAGLFKKHYTYEPVAE